MSPQPLDSTDFQARDKSEKAEYELWIDRAEKALDFTKKKFKGEAFEIIRYLNHQLPVETRLSEAKSEVNVLFPILKTLIPRLYFQDPKVFIKAMQEKIVFEEKDEFGNPILIPNEQGELIPKVREFSGPESASKLAAQINLNTKKAKLKQNTKECLEDAFVGYYGVLRTGFGNDQGVITMTSDGKAPPPSIREDVHDSMGYGYRLEPWTVATPPRQFYNPPWIVVEHTVPVEQIKQDKRLQHTSGIKGISEIEEFDDSDRFIESLSKSDRKVLKYFEVLVKPQAEYPEGKYMLLTKEVEDMFLYRDSWPFGAPRFPIKFVWFNRDIRGGLPIPEFRYIVGQQKIKADMRHANYEYVKRTIPILAVDINALDEEDKDAFTGGQIPRIVKKKSGTQKIFETTNYPNLNIDFHRFDQQLDDDVSRMVGMVKGVQTGGGTNVEFASVAKLSDENEQIRQGERADIVREFILSIVEQWADYFKEFGDEQNQVLLEGDKFPTSWSRQEIQGRFEYDIKPFSMSYEDPVILRRQWADLLNLALSPENRLALAEGGAQFNFVKIWRKLLETYHEKDVEGFLRMEFAKPENQVMRALQENAEIQQGGQGEILPTDNHKLHILIHSLMGPAGSDHILEHQQAMAEGLPGSPGGGNKEGSGVKGVAASQEQFKEPIQPSTTNQKVAIGANANRTTTER
jgi:hypothetical protein